MIGVTMKNFHIRILEIRSIIRVKILANFRFKKPYVKKQNNFYETFQIYPPNFTVQNFKNHTMFRFIHYFAKLNPQTPSTVHVFLQRTTFINYVLKDFSTTQKFRYYESKSDKNKFITLQYGNWGLKEWGQEERGYE